MFHFYCFMHHMFAVKWDNRINFNSFPNQVKKDTVFIHLQRTKSKKGKWLPGFKEREENNTKHIKGQNPL